MWGRNILLGMAIGATATFVADPQNGRRRRARAQDQFNRARRKTRNALDATVRDLSNRASGIIAAGRAVWSQEEVDDRRLLGRIRAALGRTCSHPHAIEVEVTDGVVTLRGPILASELDDVVSAVSRIRGIGDVVGELDMYESADGVPALQGNGGVAGASLGPRPNWAPATQALVTAAGLAATGLCIAKYARR